MHTCQRFRGISRVPVVPLTSHFSFALYFSSPREYRVSYFTCQRTSSYSLLLLLLLGTYFRFVSSPRAIYIRLLSVPRSLLVSSSPLCRSSLAVFACVPVSDSRARDCPYRSREIETKRSQMAAEFVLESSRISTMLDYPCPKSQCVHS